MIRKRNFIDLLINRLSGGDAPKDVRRMFAPGVVSKVVNLGLSDIVRTGRVAAQKMALRYSFTAAEDDDGFYVTLDPMPIASTLSIFMVKDSASYYNIQDSVTAYTYTVLRGDNKKGAELEGNKLRFNVEPQGTVKVTMVPNVYEMDDDGVLLPFVDEMDLGEQDFFVRCLEILRTPNYQDDLNNNSIDQQHGGQNS